MHPLKRGFIEMATGRLSQIGLENIKWWDGGDREYSVKNYLGGVDVLHSIGAMIDVFAVTGAQDRNAISKVIAKIGSINACLYLGYGNWSITSALTIPSNAWIYLPPGSMFDVSAGITLTLPSPFNLVGIQPNQQIFTGSGTVAFTGYGEQWRGWFGETLSGVSNASVQHTGATIILHGQTFGENVVFGNFLYLKSDGKWWKSDASASTTMPITGMATATVLADATGSVLMQGLATNASWTWTKGGLLYGSITAGAISHTAPIAVAEQVQVVGLALTATTIYFNPDYTLIEIA